MQKKEIFRIRFSNDKNVEGIAAHSEIELLYVIEGTVDIQVEQKYSHLQKDDILVINPDRRRSITTAENPLILHLLIDYNTICEAFQGQDVLVWCDTTSSEHEKHNELRVLLKKLIRHYVQVDNYESSFNYLADCYEILHFLSVHFIIKAADVHWNEEGDRFEERLFKINNYINSNYDQPISIKDLSEKLFLSIGYLSRFFKKNYGMNFANYLTNVRLVHAADELLYSNISVTRVAYDCGFTSAAIFNKAFKKVYNITPTEFRKQVARSEAEADESEIQEDLVNYIEHVVNEPGFIEHSEEQNNISEKIFEHTYSVNENYPFEHFWDDTINFADASNLLDSSIREQLITLKRSLNFKYVRFWSIFSRDLNISSDRDIFDFSKIDSVLDFLLEHGLKPFIELGTKPRTIHYEVGRAEKEITGDDFSPGQWKHLMIAFMRHLTARYHPNVLDGWRMELWFDEDLRFDKKEGDLYLERFDLTWEIIKSFNSKIEFGGYGIRMDFGGMQRLELYRKWKASHHLPDFLSIMYYAYERGTDGQDIFARRSTDDDAFRHFLKAEKEIIRNSGLDHIPIYISEWNYTPSVRNAINDTCFKGAYIVKNILEIFGEVKSMCYGAGSDRQYSSFDTPGLLFGASGLISKEGAFKPAAFALQFLNHTFNRCIAREKNFLITTDGHNNYSIICHNQQKLSDNYFLTPETKVQAETIWKYFDRMYSLRLQINLNDMQEGTYRIKRYCVNNNYGSIMNIWRSMNYENDLSRNDIAYLKRMCEPKMTIRKAKTVENSILIEEELEPNEITLININYVP